MCAPFRTRSPAVALFVSAIVLALLLPWLSPSRAMAADARLESAGDRREAVQQQLDAVLQRVHRLSTAAEAVEEELARLDEAHRDETRRARSANGAAVDRVVDAYKRGNANPLLGILSAESPTQSLEQARLLTILASSNQATFESASAARLRIGASASLVEATAEELAGRTAELESARAEAETLLAQAEAEESRIRDVIAAEERAREQARRRQVASRQRAAEAASAPAQTTATAAEPEPERPAAQPAQPAAASSGSVSGGIACPVGTPRNYSDTWGAPRSGGRSHKGTDILAPRGTPSYAYEAGTITRMDGSSLGGISLYMRGNSGNVYYYTHLNGYASGMSAGTSVSAGQLIAYVGDTGNAAGIPHLHFEVMPGGGGSVNPYPYVLRACG